MPTRYNPPQHVPASTLYLAVDAVHVLQPSLMHFAFRRTQRSSFVGLADDLMIGQPFGGVDAGGALVAEIELTSGTEARGSAVIC